MKVHLWKVTFTTLKSVDRVNPDRTTSSSCVSSPGHVRFLVTLTPDIPAVKEGLEDGLRNVDERNLRIN